MICTVFFIKTTALLIFVVWYFCIMVSWFSDLTFHSFTYTVNQISFSNIYASGDTEGTSCCARRVLSPLSGIRAPSSSSSPHIFHVHTKTSWRILSILVVLVVAGRVRGDRIYLSLIKWCCHLLSCFVFVHQPVFIIITGAGGGQVPLPLCLILFCLMFWDFVSVVDH